jgi:predicted PurR-regulated permease PerM
MENNKITFNKTRKHSLNSGAVVPMLVIFLGVIGGFIMSGFIGTLLGPIIFSIGYKSFDAWIEENTRDTIACSNK